MALKKKPMSIGQFIRTTRLRKGILLIDFAKAALIARPTVYRFEKAKYIHEKHLVHIARALGIKEAQLRKLNKPPS